MSRLTITLSDERYLALKEAAARQRKSIREIIESSLDLYGIKSKKNRCLVSCPGKAKQQSRRRRSADSGHGRNPRRPPDMKPPA